MKRLLLSRFGYRVSTNSFSAEENLRRDVWVKCSYFQVIVTAVSLVWGCSLMMNFDVV